MKMIVLSLALFSTLAFAEAPTALVGDFEYAETYMVERNQRVEIVEGDSDKAQERVRWLERDGHVCNSVQQGKKCVKDYPPAFAEQWIKDQVNAAFSGWILRLLQPAGEMKLVEDGEHLKVWTIAQKALLPGKATYYADYIWTDGIWSLGLHEERMPAEAIFVLSPSGLKTRLELQAGDNPPGKHQVTVKADLRRF